MSVFENIGKTYSYGFESKACLRCICTKQNKDCVQCEHVPKDKNRIQMDVLCIFDEENISDYYLKWSEKVIQQVRYCIVKEDGNSYIMRAESIYHVDPNYHVGEEENWCIHIERKKLSRKISEKIEAGQYDAVVPLIREGLRAEWSAKDIKDKLIDPPQRVRISIPQTEWRTDSVIPGWEFIIETDLA